MLLRAVRLAERQHSDPLLLRVCLSLLELSRRERLRTIILARATTTLRRMQPRCSSSELDVLRERLAEARAGVHRV
jgi:hypothetical protein